MSTPSKSSPSAFATSEKSGSPTATSSTKAPSHSAPTVPVVLLRQIPDPTEKNTNPANVRTQFSAFSIPKAQADGLKWDDSPASVVLGFPVKGTRWQGEQGKVRNPLATGLFVEMDPTNLEDFGKVQFRKVTGQFLVARQDEGPITIEDVNLLTRYLVKTSEELIPFTKEVFLSVEEKQRRANDLARRLFTPAAFQAYKATQTATA